MTRILLGAVAGCLVLILVSRIGADAVPPGAGPFEARPVLTDTVRRSVGSAPRRASVPMARPPDPATDAPTTSRTPLIDRMARMEARRRLQWAGASTFLDSLLSTPDSTVRRWPARRQVRVALLVEPALAPPVRAALAEWETVRLGVSLVVVVDTTLADVVVGSIEQFPPDGDTATPPAEGRTGLTELRSGTGGDIQHARVTVARLDGAGRALSASQLQGIALHELGHALGLPHSGSPRDVMFPTVSAASLSDRDRASARLLYSLPAGSLRDSPVP